MISWFLLGWHALRISLKIMIIQKNIKKSIYDLILYGKVIKPALERKTKIWLWRKLKISEFVGMENLKWSDMLILIVFLLRRIAKQWLSIVTEILFCIFYLQSWWYVLQNSGYLLLRKWSDMLYFNSVFAERYCIIMVIYCYGNVILHILSAFMVIRNPFPLLLNPLILKTRVHLQFQEISDWPIWLLIDPL